MTESFPDAAMRERLRKMTRAGWTVAMIAAQIRRGPEFTKNVLAALGLVPNG